MPLSVTPPCPLKCRYQQYGTQVEDIRAAAATLEDLAELY